MRKVILDVAISLDGYIEGPNGEYDWCFVDQDYGFTELLNKIDTIFYGRKSWELFGNYFPSENSPEIEKKMFKMMSRKKKYVFSRTLKSVEGATLISSNIEEEVNKIKQKPGQDIHLFGGASLVTTFVNSNLIDEYLLAVHPVILGAGKPLFIDIKERKNLELTDSKVFSNGLVILQYVPSASN
ncbi:MAG TPA: dihydrofolate reductase family protein [Ignavibacteriaceae bacterium]|nr:dihydrofolate reductase family protein [Ignavibacteriaceae bacterium]